MNGRYPLSNPLDPRNNPAMNPNLRKNINPIKEKKSQKGLVIISSIFIMAIGIVIYFVSRIWWLAAIFIFIGLMFIILSLFSGKKNKEQGNMQRYQQGY